MCARPSVDGMTHTKCMKPHGIDGVYSLFPYKGIVRKPLLAMKYKYAEDIASELANVAVTKIEKLISLPKNPILIPVPLHEKRKKWRGFNQAEAVGKIIANKNGWSILDDLIVRQKYKIPQTELKREDRINSVVGIFELNSKYKGKISGKRPAIIFDDVWTTGSTLKEVAKVLKRNGFKKVWGLTIAK